MTLLILLKDVLFAHNSRLISDKANLGFGFPCDGPGRGGTCQASAWNHVFLGLLSDASNHFLVFGHHFEWCLNTAATDAQNKISGIGEC